MICLVKLTMMLLAMPNGSRVLKLSISRSKQTLKMAQIAMVDSVVLYTYWLPAAIVFSLFGHSGYLM